MTGKQADRLVNTLLSLSDEQLRLLWRMVYLLWGYRAISRLQGKAPQI